MTRLACGLVVALAPLGAALFAGAAFAGDAPDPPAAPVIRAIRWEGTHAVSNETLADHLFTETPGWRPWKPWGRKPPFDPQVLEADLKRIAAVYRTAGYYQADARSELAWNEAGDEVTITLHVEEGEPVWLAWWDVDLAALPGGSEALRAELLGGLPLAPGTVFRVEDYGGAKQELLARLAARGHPDATLEGGADVDVERRSAFVWWKVWPGPRVRVGEIHVRGLERVDETLVRRELGFAPGDVYDLAEVRATQRRLYDLGLFRAVVIQPERPPPGAAYAGADTEVSRDVEIELTERPPRSVRIGVGYGTEDRVRVRASWLHRNFFGGARRLELTGRVSSLTTTFEGTLRKPHFLEERTALVVRSSLGEDDVPAYDAARFQNRVGVERPFGRHWLAHAAYGIEWYDFSDVPGEAVALLDDPERRARVGFLHLGLRRSTTDDVLEPTRGTRLDLALEPAARWLGADESFVRMTAEARAYTPLSLPRAGTVLATRLELGTAAPFAGSRTDRIPLSRRFYAGGADSVRGFEYQRMGPPEAEDAAVGGASLFEASAELRVPVWRDISGVMFLDAGQLSLDAFDWRPGDVRFAGGGGLRYATPLGPIRFDVGRAFEGGGEVRFFFSVGHAF